MPLGRFQPVVDYETYLARAHVMVMLGEARAALAYLEPALLLAQDQGFMTPVIALSLAQALACNAIGESRRSWAVLERALAAAEQGGHLHAFDQGEHLKQLLAEAASRGMRRHQVRGILQALGWPAAHAHGERGRVPEEPRQLRFLGQADQSAPDLVEPLSEREQEILELIAAGLSNAQIAARLYIGIGTVKTHVNHLFGKLGVSSRTQLIAHARMLKLLP